MFLDDLGGKKTLQKVHKIFYNKLYAHPWLKSFFEEGRALTQISHASVVSVLNFFRENETVYMVMNFLRGASLQEYIVTARAQQHAYTPLQVVGERARECRQQHPGCR